MKETMAEMMARLAEGMPSKHWIATSVGIVNMRNKAAALNAAIRLEELKKRKAGVNTNG